MNYNFSRTSRQALVERPSASGMNMRIVLFDQLVTFDLTGKRENVLSKVINFSVEGYFVATSLSYSLLPPQTVQFGPVSTEPIPAPGPLALKPAGTAASKKSGKRAPAKAGASANTPIRDLTIARLCNGFGEFLGRMGLSDAAIAERKKQLLVVGFRLNPALAGLVLSQFAVDDFPVFDTINLSAEEIERLFETVSFPANQVNFLYRLSDNATSREFQSEPIHNIAGLGIADGDRPFRTFPQPIVFPPRSVLRVEITEIAGMGRLYFVLQGYKALRA